MIAQAAGGVRSRWSRRRGRPAPPPARTDRPGVAANRWKATAVITSKTVIGAPAFTALHLLQRGGQRVVGDQRAGDADALVEAHQMRRGVDMHAQPRGLGRWRAGRRRCCPCRWCPRHGSPAAGAARDGRACASSRCSRSRLRSISRGCRPCSRATIAFDASGGASDARLRCRAAVPSAAQQADQPRQRRLHARCA